MIFSKKSYDTGQLEKDFFLIKDIINDKEEIVKNITLDLIILHTGKKISDEEINKVAGDITKEIIDLLSNKYIKFLTKKYFKSKEAFVLDLSRRVYVRVFNLAVVRNIKFSLDNEKLRNADYNELYEEMPELNKTE